MKLFSDGHLRAEEAVCHLREQMEQRNTGERSPKSPSPLKGKEVSVPGMFPASFPSAQTRQIDIPNMSQDPPLSVPYSKKSFDDGISIITQYTLDEEAKMYQEENDLLLTVHSDITQDPIEEVEESWKHTVDPNRGDSHSLRRQQKGMSPLALTRQGRSHGTMNTKQSRGTMGTKSTMSTQTNEMASLWKKEEQKYWHDLVEQDAPTNPASISSKHERFIKARENTRRNGRGDRSYENVSFLSRCRKSTFLFDLLYSLLRIILCLIEGKARWSSNCYALLDLPWTIFSRTISNPRGSRQINGGVGNASWN
jgi:hypothetical protein